MDDVAITRGPARIPLERSLVAVLEISQTINLALGLREMLQLLAQKVHELMGYDCAVILMDPDTLLLTWAGSYGLSDAYVAAANEQQNNLLTPAMAGGATGRAFKSRQQVQIRNVTARSVRPWRDMMVKEGIASYITTPMELHGRIVGFVNCYTRSPHVFSRPEMDLLSIMANQAAIAIEAARLYEHERQRAAELDRLNHTLSEQRELLERQNAQLVQGEEIHRQLTRVILDDSGLEAILARIAELIGRPVVLYDDQSLHLTAVPEEHDPEVVERLASITSKLPPGQSSGSTDVVEGASYYTVPIQAGGARLADLVVVEAPDRLSGLDLRAIEHGATAVALELLKQRAVMQIEQQVRGSFLDDLLAGEFESEESIVRRARYLGFDLTSRYRVFAVGLDQEGDAQNRGTVDDLQRRIVNLTGSSWVVDRLKGAVTRKGDTVVVLWPEALDARITPAKAARTLADDIRRSLRGQTVSVGIGSSCYEPASFSRSYVEARYCLDVLYRFDNTNRALSIDDLGLHRFLLRAREEAPLLEFAHARLDRLLEHDLKHSVQLQKTLRAYIGTDCSLVRTAEQLVLHINTVQYRLRRVEALTGLHLRSPQGLMEIQLALLVASLSPRAFPGLDTEVLPVPETR